MKRYYIEYQVDNNVTCKVHWHHWCNASTLNSAKCIATKVSKKQGVKFVHVIDTLSEDENGYAPIVFEI